MARYDKDIADGLVHGTTLLSSLGGLTGVDDQSSSNDDQLTIKDTEVVINEDGDDLDFRVEGNVETHLLFVDGGNERISIGDSVDAPAATLEVTNHPTAGAFGVPLVQLNSHDTDKIALDINAANIDANVIDIVADTVTSAAVISISADGLSDGTALYIDSDSGVDTARSVAHIIQNHTSAPKANTLTLQQDDTTTGTTEMAASLNFTGTPKIKVGTNAADLVFYQYDGYEVARIHDGGTTSAGGGFGYRKRVLEVEAALDLSSVDTAVPYSGAILSVSQQESDGAAYAITLPTATSAAEGKKILGWHISIIVTLAEAMDITVVRDDTSNDFLVGTVVAGDAASSGITIGSHVITFVGGTATEGDRVDITCVVADASNTVFSAQGFCAV